MEIINAIYRIEETDNGGYQKWTGKPDTPELTSSYPYQCMDSDGTRLLICAERMYCTGSSGGYWVVTTGTAPITLYILTDGVWVNSGFALQFRYFYLFSQANADLWSSLSGGTYFSKTTTNLQDAGKAESKIRIRTMVRL